jgi:GT2 family glycosyltransferase
MEADQKLKGNYGFLSSIAYWKDGSICNMNVQRVGLHKKIEEYKEITPIIMATFVSFFIKSETVVNFGLPIKDFFIWADDLEYSRRISRVETCYAVPDSIVEHYMESNEKVNVAKESPDRMWRYDYLYRNEVYVYRREGIKGCIYLLVRMMKHSLLILKDSKGERILKLKRIWKSFGAGWSFKPKTEYVKMTDK